MFPVLRPADILQEERTRVAEVWSDAARLASARSRAAQAWASRDASANAAKRFRDTEVKRRREAAKKKAGGKGPDPEAEAKKAEREARAEKARPFDERLKAQAAELKAMAARGEKGSEAYRQKYDAYRATQLDKRKALGTDAVEAPDKAPKAKAEPEPKKASPKAKPKVRRVVHRPPASRNRWRGARVARTD